MSIFEWALLGALMLGLLIFCARIMRRGLTTLDDDRKKTRERIEEARRRVAEDKKNISAGEQIYLAQAAIADLIRLDCRESECSLKTGDHLIDLATPDGAWQIELLMRERSLRSRHKVLHGQSRWLLHGPGINEEHRELATLMASLARQLRGVPEIEPIPAHLARRLAAPTHGALKFRHRNRYLPY